MGNEQLSMFEDKKGTIREGYRASPRTGIEFTVRKEAAMPKPVQEKKTRKRVANDSTYAAFYREGSVLDRDIKRSVESKKGLLERYFPGRFGENGRQPIKSMEDYRAGVIFNQLIEYSETRISQ